MNDHEAAPRISGPFAPVGAVVGGVVGGGAVGHYFDEKTDDTINNGALN